MSHAAMTHSFEVWSRDTPDATTGVATWTLKASGLAGSLTELSPEGARREVRGGTDEPTVTHVVRMMADANADEGDGDSVVRGGRRLRDEADGKEYVVKAPRWRSNPPPGTLIVPVAGGTKAATQG